MSLDGSHPDVCAAGLQAPGGAISPSLRVGLPGDERRQDCPAADVQMSVTTRVSFTFCIF